MIKKLRKVDHDTFNEESRNMQRVTEELYPMLRQYSHFLTQNYWDGDEIAQEAMIKALKHYNLDCISVPLLNKIAYHTWIDTIRKRKSEDITDHIENIVSKETTDMSEIEGMVSYLLSNLTPKQAVIFILKEAFQYRANEIADLVGSTETGVKSLLYRAKRRVAKEKNHIGFTTNCSELDEAEFEELYEVIYEALKEQDPTILIDTIPTIRSLESQSTTSLHLLSSFRARSTSPSSGLRMAA
ncbi:sigma-70 family RNA polymerase sigma factor [Cytobacillus sp. FJAT-54145]|uniref:Sigma-70 family RNA polymerase sigma factor n=1 Tax=Cytobacillus spartinae TaxID=3299023 RepID=A0ABW6KGQ1_9BACI